MSDVAEGHAGKLIRIGGHRLHVLDCGTAGPEPTVVFESGLAAPLQSWTWVQEILSAQTRTISYERAGIGWSEPGPGPRTVPRLAAELQRLLRALNVDGPVVLVGHSFGGLVVRCFAEAYPSRVQGIVFVDSLHPEELRSSATQRRGMAWLEQSLNLSALRALLRLGRREIANQYTDLPLEAAAQARARLNVPTTWRTAANELVCWKNSNPRDIGVGGFPGDVPLGVLVSGESLRNDVAHRKLQDSLLTLSSNSFVALAKDASHFGLLLEHTHSGVVAETVSKVVAFGSVTTTGEEDRVVH